MRFATTTGYRAVEPGPWRLRLGGPNGPTADTRVTLTPGAVYSLLVLDAERSRLTAELREDARGGAVTPTGGVDTGAGGLALRGGSTPSPGSDAPAAGEPAPPGADTSPPGADGTTTAGDARAGGGAGWPVGTYPVLLGGLVAALAVAGGRALRRRRWRPGR
ncbi:hypothetical protein E1091_09780 [Micromonospora fluostatini]|uniref:DUF4397 domain-containing protein n=1 Tax=Micromonospora fluostatini TaxID=1629071 RepID=A0ABY2DHT9_9ACTN|nr:hypothetical protein E1091_09780 [Micromonospora fluostatini]